MRRLNLSRREATVLGVLALLAVVVVAGSVAWLGRSTDRRADQIDTNTAAIREGRDSFLLGCRVLARAIAQSGAGGDIDPESPQARLTALYVRVLNRAMTPTERREERRLQVLIAQRGGTVEIPDCEQIASDPDSVEFPTPVAPPALPHPNP